ncbi:helix-turn-helix domain-containing protein [Actinoplanes sp. RD1]|uniref:helix-turn-helix domain-containing protein n=1 Tax=Actinoplanes sp. RD1 TaxID=3064538 RepID=UPI002740DA28|nr:helix-turn-helix transcriptional regulator [Actinoplanes sp. RD1]
MSSTSPHPPEPSSDADSEPRSAGRGVRLVVAGSLAFGSLTGTGTTAPIVEPQVWYIGDRTSTGRVIVTSDAAGMSAPAKPDPVDVAPVSSAATPRTAQAAEVRWLREASGLTWEQLGRLFGVSRRAVHLWATGGRMNSSNAELLAELVGLVRELPGGPDDRRAALLAPTADGSIVDRIRGRHRSDARDFSGTPFAPEELLGGSHVDEVER